MAPSRSIGTALADDDEPRKPLSDDSSGASTPRECDLHGSSRSPAAPARIAACALAGDEAADAAANRSYAAADASESLDDANALSLPLAALRSRAFSEEASEAKLAEIGAEIALSYTAEDFQAQQPRPCERSSPRAAPASSPRLLEEEGVPRPLERSSPRVSPRTLEEEELATKLAQAEAMAAIAAAGESRQRGYYSRTEADEAAGIGIARKRKDSGQSPKKACTDQKCASGHDCIVM